MNNSNRRRAILSAVIVLGILGVAWVWSHASGTPAPPARSNADRKIGSQTQGESANASDPAVNSNARPATDLPLYTLLDQNDKPFPKSEATQGVVVIFVGAKFREQTPPWSDYLGEHLPKGCVMANVLDLRTMMRATKRIVSMQINAEADDEKTRIWLDWDGTMADHLRVSLDELNVVCLNAKGEVLLHLKDNFSDELGRRVLNLYPASEDGQAVAP